MTTLGNKFVVRGKDYSIYLSVSGDLSFSYQLIPTSSIQGGSMGVGFGFNSLADAKLGLKNARAWGYGSDRFRKWYERRVTSNDEYRFGYLPPRMAKPYLEDAYGDYAERLRRGKP